MARAGSMSSSSDKLRSRFETLLGRESRPHALDADEKADWAAATADVRPLGDEAKRARSAPERRSFTPKSGAPVAAAPVANRPIGQGLDKGTDRKLRRGALPIEGRIDLHGMTAQRARSALAHYLHAAQSRGARCVLVITGKGARTGTDDFGRPQAGILRSALPEWLAAPDIAPMVVAWREAQPKDGGSGASYVLVRRRR